jgi:DNA invertase Pin-like site-specific DNA recombinase
MVNLLTCFRDLEQAVLLKRVGLKPEFSYLERDTLDPDPLSIEQQKHIVELVDAGMTAGEVARLFKVHPATIGRLLQPQAARVQEQVER